MRPSFLSERRNALRVPRAYFFYFFFLQATVYLLVLLCDGGLEKEIKEEEKEKWARSATL
jgi:hypothetical protein